MAFLTESELKKIPFKHCGNDVKISSRAAIYNPELISIGDHSRIDDFSILSGNVEIGRCVHIAAHSNISGGEKGILFDDFSGFAYGVLAFTQSDDYSGKYMTNPLIDKEFLGTKFARIEIGRHAIVGAHSVVFPGVILSTGCSVGAMSMVTKSTEEWSINFGVPSKKIKNRRKDVLELEKLFLEKHSLDWGN